MSFTKELLLVLILLINDLNCEKVFVRKNSKDLTFNEWQDLKRGIRAMKLRHIRNPLGYHFQANIHGWDEYDGSDTSDYIADHFNWHKCTHAHYFFLVWHRMYLYFFERILREASGNPNLTLPYWDYSDPQQWELPQPFRIPANNISNPLYVSQRCKNINEGKPLNSETTDPSPALSTNFFSANVSNELNICHSFGGGRLENPTFDSNREGLLERLPHNRLHIYIGGPNGLMADLCRAAQDPIFWLNHCMVDRIWESWIHSGGKNLVEESYLNQIFKFYDERGKLGAYRVRDFLNITELNYKYDSLIKTEKKIEITRDENPKLFFSVNEIHGLYINNTKRSIILKIIPKFQSLFEDIAKGVINKRDIRFTLQTVLAASQSGLLFHLFLNLPKQTVPYESSPNFIGTISHFEAHCIPRERRKPLDITHCFDITDNLFMILRNDYNFNGNVPKKFNLTIVPKSCDTVYYPENEEYIIKFHRTLLIHYFTSTMKNEQSNNLTESDSQIDSDMVNRTLI